MIREVVQGDEAAAADARQRMLDRLAKLRQLDPDLVEVTIHDDGRVTLDFTIDDHKAPLKQLAYLLRYVARQVERL